MTSDGYSMLDRHSFIEEAEYHRFSGVVAENYHGSGLIVDAGCFAGASTHALCSGVQKALLESSDDKKVVAIDRFLVADRYIAENFVESGIDIRFGESFLSVFIDNLREYIAHIDVRAGELMQVGRIDGPIEILVVDIAKSSALNAFILYNWFKNLIPGRSIVIHQDFYAPTQPWIAVSMGALLDYFSIYEEKVGESAIFRLERPIPPAAIQDAIRLNWRTPRALAELDNILRKLSEANRGPTLLMKALVMHHLGRTPEARNMLDTLAALDPPPKDKKWEKWLAMAMVAVDPGAFSKERLLASVYLKDASLLSAPLDSAR